MSEESILKKITDHATALQQAIEHHCKGLVVPPRIAENCPHHAKMLNERPCPMEDDNAHS